VHFRKRYSSPTSKIRIYQRSNKCRVTEVNRLTGNCLNMGGWTTYQLWRQLIP
jgi:hypothetical protein